LSHVRISLFAFCNGCPLLGEPSSIVIPYTVREIGKRAFYLVASLRDLSFEEGLERIGEWAFTGCNWLALVGAFPASLEVIEKSAFNSCFMVPSVPFPVGSKLRWIGKKAFWRCECHRVVLPPTVRNVDPSAFEYHVWGIVNWDDHRPRLARGYFLSSADARILLYCLSE
jgi:hypothetical protein